MRLTGLPVDRFSALLAGAMPLIAAAECQRLSRRERRRGTGAGMKHDLPLCGRLLMTLVYYRTYVAQEFLGYLSGLNASNVGRNLAQIRPVLAPVFGIPRAAHCDDAKSRDHPFFDATGQRLNRPQGRVMQKKFYPGKNKTHTAKCQAVVYRYPGDKRPLIAALPPSRYGKTDAKKIYAQARVITPKGINRGGGAAFRDRCRSRSAPAAARGVFAD
jgi:hypothetical protein